jgi:hypothetical protein
MMTMRTLAVLLAASLALVAGTASAASAASTPSSVLPPGGDCQGLVDFDCDNHDLIVKGSHCAIWIHLVVCIA